MLYDLQWTTRATNYRIDPFINIYEYSTRTRVPFFCKLVGWIIYISIVFSPPIHPPSYTYDDCYVRSELWIRFTIISRNFSYALNTLSDYTLLPYNLPSLWHIGHQTHTNTHTHSLTFIIQTIAIADNYAFDNHKNQTLRKHGKCLFNEYICKSITFASPIAVAVYSRLRSVVGQHAPRTESIDGRPPAYRWLSHSRR